MANSQRIDLGAVMLSVLCIIHCIALPLLVTLGPVGLLHGFDEQGFHWFMLVVALPLSALGLWQGFQRHARVLVPVIGAVGLALMAWDLVPQAVHSHNWTLPGVLLIALAHLLNIRGLRLHRADCC